MSRTATVGAVENGNSVVLVTVCGTTLVDRRQVNLTRDLPTHPHHHEGSWAVGRYRNSPWSREVTLPEAIALVREVEVAALHGARRLLAELADAVSVPISGIALRECPTLPETIEARIRDNRAQTLADTVMYRNALATAAADCGWVVTWYDRDLVAQQAAELLEDRDLPAVLKEMGRTCGPPWQARHKLAATAAITAGC